jgi:predicted DNA-binding transcriptional regulator AlpA
MIPTSRRLIPKREVQRRTGLSNDTLHRLMRKGLFPVSVKIPGSRLVFWYEDEIIAWMAKLERGVSDHRPIRVNQEPAKPLRRAVLGD